MATKSGRITFVGVGPGDPELLTLKAQRIIQAADVILHDKLVHPNILAMATVDAICIDVGKQKGKHYKKQDEINALLVNYAKEGKTVARLKGGDPSIFGRLGEEISALGDIPFEIIPGITSAIAVPLYAGIPITHRDHSRSVAFMTGTTKTGDAISKKDIPDADTIICLMAVSQLPHLIPLFLESPRFTSDTPVAIISKGTTAQQKVEKRTLGTLLSRPVTVAYPALMVVGDVVEAQKTWAEKLPLFGKRYWVFRPFEQAKKWADKLSPLGADVRICPLIHIMPKDCQWPDLSRYTMLILTSQHAVHALWHHLQKTEKDVRELSHLHLVSVGNATTEALNNIGLVPDIEPKIPNQEGIATCLPEDLSGVQVLFPSAAQARPWLKQELQNRGATVEQLTVYTIQKKQPQTPITLEPEDTLIFTSQTIVEAFFAATTVPDVSLEAICISERVAETLRQQLSKGHQLKISVAADMDIIQKIITKL